MTRMPETPRAKAPILRRVPAPAAASAAATKRTSATTGTAGAAPTSRLNKRMSELGLCSRREADEWIANGWVRVNGKTAQMGQPVTQADRIEVDDAARGQQAQRVTILLNKPMGFVSGLPEDGHEPAMALLQPQNRWREDRSKIQFSAAQFKGLAPAGRLDIDSIGLIVFTQDGRIARHLIGEESVVEKEYLVRVSYEHLGRTIEKNVAEHFPRELIERLRHGLSLDGQALKPAKVSWQNEEQLRFVLTEGKKRQIRRMCELVGLKVIGLKRIRIGAVNLGNLPIGQWRYLASHERF